MKTETSDSVDLVRVGFDYGLRHGALEVRYSVLAGVSLYALMLLGGTLYLCCTLRPPDRLVRRVWYEPHAEPAVVDAPIAQLNVDARSHDDNLLPPY